MTRYWTVEQMLAHLPLVYRQRDAETAARLGLPEGQGPLYALLEAISRQVGLVEEEIAQTYDNWFIETCEEWLLPHMAELLAIDNVPDFADQRLSPRRYIANMLSYRAGKGTPRVLEEVVQDATGWFTEVVEYFLHLSRTAHVNRFEEHEILGIDVHDLMALENLDTPFDPSFRLPDVRRISSRHQAGRHNLPNVGAHVWPIRDYPWQTIPPGRFAVSAQPQQIAGEPERSRWTVHPFGIDAPLFNEPQPDSAHRQVPEVLSRLRLHQELENLRVSIALGEPRPELEFFGSDRPVISLYLDGGVAPIPPEEIVIVDFTRGWPAPGPTKAYPDAQQGSVDLPVSVALDPHLGRMVFPVGAEPNDVRCEYCYGFSNDSLGGAYDRRDSFDVSQSVGWLVGVSQLAGVSGTSFDNLPDAIDDWNAQPPGTNGVLCIMDNVIYRENAPLQIEIPRGSTLLIVAAHEPQLVDGSAVFSSSSLRGNLDLDIRVTGLTQGDGDFGSLSLNGVYISGSIRVMAGQLGSLDIAHSTVREGVRISAAGTNNNAGLQINVTQTHLTSIQLPDPVQELNFSNSLLGNPEDFTVEAVAAGAALCTFSACTVFGPVEVREIWTDNCIFLQPINSLRSQSGCLRYSYVAPGSHTPRRYECQPDNAVRANPDIDRVVVEQQLRPVFESLDPGDPAFARLKGTTHRGILEGGEQGVEMGFFAGLLHPQKTRFAQQNISDFTRAGMDADLITNTVKDLVNYGSQEQSP